MNAWYCLVGGWFNHPEFNFPVRRFVWYLSGQIMHRIKRPELHALFFSKSRRVRGICLPLALANVFQVLSSTAVEGTR
jgi:hypothetical protein